MAIQDILSFETCFELDNSPKNFKITDLTNYTSEGIDPIDVDVLFKITGPLGIIYENTDAGNPDILTGKAITAVNQGAKTFTIGSIDLTSVLRDGEVFVVLNSTGNDGTYTIVSSTFNAGDTDVVVVETIPSAVVNGLLKYYIFTATSLPLDVNGDVLKGKYTIKATVIVLGIFQPGTYIKTDEYDFCYTSPKVVIEPTVDCFCSIITSKDLTDYGLFNTTLTRVHTVFPPPASTLSPTIGAGATVVVGPSPNIVIGTWSSKIVTGLRYDFTDGLCVIDQVEGADEYKVECDLSLCDVFCCVQTLLKNYQEALLTNPTRAEQIQHKQLFPVIANMVLFQQAIQCGETAQASSLLQNILDVSGCEAGCACEDDNVPTQVIPFCGTSSGTNVVVEGQNGITVISNTVGDTTTYTVEIEANLKAKIDDLRNVFVLSGTNINITPVINPNGSESYTVNFTGTIPAARETLNILLEIVTPNIRGTGVIPTYAAAIPDTSDTLTVLYPGAATAKFNGSAMQEYEKTKSGDGSLSYSDIMDLTYDDFVRIKIDAFLDTASDPFTFDASVWAKNLYDSLIAMPIQVVTHYQEDDTLIIKLLDTNTGDELEWYDLVQMLDPSQTLCFKINAYA